VLAAVATEDAVGGNTSGDDEDRLTGLRVYEPCLCLSFRSAGTEADEVPERPASPGPGA